MRSPLRLIMMGGVVMEVLLFVDTIFRVATSSITIWSKIQECLKNKKNP